MTAGTEPTTGTGPTTGTARTAPLAGALKAAAAVAVLVLLTAACTIETGDESASTTTVVPPAQPVSDDPTGSTLPPGEEAGPSLNDVVVELTEVAEVDRPTAVSPRSGSESIYVAERGGAIREITREFRTDSRGNRTLSRISVNRTPLLDLSDDVNDENPQQGLLGLAFSTDGARVYVSYTNDDDALVVDEFRITDNRADPRSRKEMLLIDQVDETNNGGGLALGSDGYLWIGLGDGGGEGDPASAGQDIGSPLGSLLRIDPEAGEGEPYVIPLGNPYLDDPDAIPEVWLKGVRNPQRFSFDPLDGDLWVADNGESGIAEINLLLDDDGLGRAANLGWSEMEGTQTYNGGTEPEDHVRPILEYGPDQGCGVVGGQVYRGTRIPTMYGAYVFGDFCGGKLRLVIQEEGAVTQDRTLDVGVPAEELSGFGVDPDGELLVFTNTGVIYRIDPPPEEEE